MNPNDMNRLIELHLAAEQAKDPAASVAVYSDDVEHDVVGSPTGPVQGKVAAQRFYEYLNQNIDTQDMIPTHTYYGEDFCVIEHTWTGIVPGEFLGVPGDGKRISFRMIHIWEFRDGLISRENVWLDGAAIVAQLTAPQLASATR
jgi:steroid delta-isomerase-like uncharacterized protein